MHAITLPKHAIYMLHTLSKSVTEITGYRCKLSRSKELIHLLKLASLVKNRRIRGQFSRFLSQLDIEQLKSLLRSGIQLPVKLIKKVQQPFWLRASSTLVERTKSTLAKIQRKLIDNPLLAN